MAKYFYRQLNNPRIKKITPSKSNIFALSTKKIVKFNGLDIVTYRWQGNNGKVLIIHGWEGRATNFESIIKELVNQRFDVTIFEGSSSIGGAWRFDRFGPKYSNIIYPLTAHEKKNF